MNNPLPDKAAANAAHERLRAHEELHGMNLTASEVIQLANGELDPNHCTGCRMAAERATTKRQSTARLPRPSLVRLLDEAKFFELPIPKRKDGTTDIGQLEQDVATRRNHGELPAGEYEASESQREKFGQLRIVVEDVPRPSSPATDKERFPDRTCLYCKEVVGYFSPCSCADEPSITGDGKEARGAKLTQDSGSSMNLREMQLTQPWNAPYSREFLASADSGETHRWLTHDLLHVTKAVGILASIAEWADHGIVRTERVDQAEFEGRIADLVMCALHMANNAPKGYREFDLLNEVINRVDRVNNADWKAIVREQR